MQLEKIVAYHKAMGDPTRIRMLMLLAEQERSGQELAELLHLSQPTITHHAAKLREAALIKERRDRNTVYFQVNPYFIEQGAAASVANILNRTGGGQAMEDTTQQSDQETLKQSVLRNFFAKDGRLKQIPAQLKKKVIVLEHLAEQLTPGRKYEEKEINEFIKQYHEDFATLRREFIMHQFMYREEGVYELNPKTMWTSWQQLR
ncbi:ArsR family transcriptional regulator [Paenibacillus yonginensis]|uniref:ArsR family transcriptional regulator n=1 Tax=Paenibacillus yonginensis TaxID=1462996 RepID=A0A1B1MY56_9BACL|nr:metalloregulator ArsR/SmtB family transcription factor [Paenibacillus yonginensis]ANS74096.1 ArsR family transcriptional regulator [Paenibacillus yonginensis]